MVSEATVTIERPIDEVFEFATNNVAEWSLVVVEDEVIDAAPDGEAGTTFRAMLASTEALARLRGNDSHSTLEARARLIQFLGASDGLGYPVLSEQRELMLTALRDSDQFGFSWRILEAALFPLGTGDADIDGVLREFDPNEGLPQSFYSACDRVAQNGGLEPPQDRLLAELLLYTAQSQPGVDPQNMIEMLDCALQLWGSPEESPMLLGADLFATRAAFHHSLGEWEAAVLDGEMGHDLYNAAGAIQSHSAMICAAGLAQSMCELGDEVGALRLLRSVQARAKNLLGSESLFSKAVAKELIALLQKKK